MENAWLLPGRQRLPDAQGDKQAKGAKAFGLNLAAIIYRRAQVKLVERVRAGRVMVDPGASSNLTSACCRGRVYHECESAEETGEAIAK